MDFIVQGGLRTGPDSNIARKRNQVAVERTARIVFGYDGLIAAQDFPNEVWKRDDLKLLLRGAIAVKMVAREDGEVA